MVVYGLNNLPEVVHQKVSFMKSHCSVLLWLFNQPPPNVPPRNKALLRAYYPLVSLIRGGLG